jgi:hypothetical protein
MFCSSLNEVHVLDYPRFSIIRKLLHHNYPDNREDTVTELCRNFKDIISFPSVMRENTENLLVTSVEIILEVNY